MDFAKKEGIARGLQFCLIGHYANENKITPRLLGYDLDDFVFMLKKSLTWRPCRYRRRILQRYRKFYNSKAKLSMKKPTNE